MNQRVKHIILLIIAGWIALVAQMATAQSANRNYVRVLEAIEPSTQEPYPYSDLSKMSVTYFDGLGRKVSTVKAGASEAVFDIADFTVYDNCGRVKMEYLPIELPDVNGFYPSNFDYNAKTFHNDSRPFTEYIYDNASDNRIVEARLPGEKWHNDNKHARNSYDFNGVTGETACRRYDVNDKGELVNAGIYSQGSLRVTFSCDEDSNRMATFHDKAGRKLLVRRFLERFAAPSILVDTYFVYDRYGRLRYMISPEGAKLLGDEGICDSETISLYCFSYEYDSRNRCVVKRLPGAEPVYFVYDKLNRVVFSQDGAQRSSSTWLVTKYDNRHRIAVEGVATIPGSTRESLQNQWGDTLLIESHDPSIMTESLLQYTSNFDIPGFVAHKAYFYDNYSHWSAVAAFPHDDAFESATAVSADGLLTGTALTDFSGNCYVTLAVYDRKGNVVLEAERDIYGQSHQVVNFFKYDFPGNPVKRKRVTSFLAEQMVTAEHSEEWDNYFGIWGQLYQSRHRYGNGEWVNLSLTGYDIDGRILSKARGKYNNIGLKTYYDYNIRGWLTSQSSPVFSQNLFYNTRMDSLPGVRPSVQNIFHNGNIAGWNESRWTPQGTVTGYRVVSYDNLGRITTVNDSEPERFSESYSYDLNGNITHIQRGGLPNTRFDDISVSYLGNRINRVVDNSGNDNLLGVIPQIPAALTLSPADTVGYDASGRMTSDYSRGVTQITYNPLGLPSAVRMGTKDRINYTYRADGVKMHEQSTHQYTKLVMKVSASGDTSYIERKAYDTRSRRRYGDYVTETGMPDKIYNEEGYIALHGDSVSYHFFERDYLGSVRAVFDLYGNLEQTNDYNVTGIPSSRHLGNADAHKHTGKEFQGFNGLAWYDNNARYYDPILARFTTQDPLAEKYPWLSPYNHCANNPLRFVDRDGLKFHENMTEEQKQAYHEIVEPLFQHSSLFRMVYNFVDSHKDIITVQFGETVKDANGNHVPGQFDATNKTITFLNGQAPSSSTTIEEIYHSYQNLTPSSEDASTNFEFEAKTFTIFSSYEGNYLFGGDEILYRYSNSIIDNISDSNNNLIYNSNTLNDIYLNIGKEFVNHHIQINSNSYYTTPVTFIPSRLSNLLKTLGK